MTLEYPIRRYDTEWRRIIPSRFPPIEVYERLGSDELARAAKALEAGTNPRLAAKAWLTRGAQAVDGNAPRLQNWNHAPFAYRNPAGTRFLGNAYGVFEAANDVRAALGYAVRRREAFLGATEQEPTELDMRLLTTQIAGEFYDLTAISPDEPEVDRRRVGETLHRSGAAGIVFRRPEYPDGLFLGLFDPRLLTHSVQCTHYRFIWDGEAVRSVYDFSTGEELLREDIFAASDQEAA